VHAVSGVILIDLEAYKELVRAVELAELYVTEFRSSRQADIEFPLRFSTALRLDEPVFAPRALIVEPVFQLSAGKDDVQAADATSALVEIKIVWRVVYSFGDKDPRDFDEALVHEFVRRNVPLNVWPYARAAVTAATAQMGLPPLVIETYKVLG